MRTHIVEAVWLNDAGLCSLEQLAAYSGLTQAELQDLIEMGRLRLPALTRKTIYIRPITL